MFLTIGYMQKLLRLTGSRKTGEDFAAECLNEILPRLGHLEDTGLVKKGTCTKRPHPLKKKAAATHNPPTSTRSGGESSESPFSPSFASFSAPD